PCNLAKSPCISPNCRERPVGFGLPAQPPSRGVSGPLLIVRLRVRKKPGNPPQNWHASAGRVLRDALLVRERAIFRPLSLQAIFGGHTCRGADDPTIRLMRCWFRLR